MPLGEPAIEDLAMEVIEHEGHTITFDVAHRGKGWTWTYQIDSGPVIANDGEPHADESMARLEAIAVAKFEIRRDDPAAK